LRSTVVVVRALLSLLLFLVACGRSAEPVVACPQPADACEELEEQQQGVEAVYAAAAADDDAVAMDESAQCVQVFVDQSIDLGCVPACEALCRLHPCVVVDDEGNTFDPSACPARCDQLVKDGAVSVVDVDAAAVKAGENPELCSCTACEQGDVLCTRLFACG
jgi:hypothetical protein